MGRYIVVKAVIKDKMYVLVNIYAPNKDEDIINFLKKLQTENLDSEENIVIGGDFNGPFAASGHMVHAGGQAAHWDIQNKATSSR